MEDSKDSSLHLFASAKCTSNSFQTLSQIILSCLTHKISFHEFSTSRGRRRKQTFAGDKLPLAVASMHRNHLFQFALWAVHLYFTYTYENMLQESVGAPVRPHTFTHTVTARGTLDHYLWHLIFGVFNTPFPTDRTNELQLELPIGGLKTQPSTFVSKPSSKLKIINSAFQKSNYQW